MKLLYISTTRFPDNWANTLQIAKTCEALARAGAEVELVVPERHSTASGDPFAAMGVAPVFKLTRLPALDLMRSHIPFAFNLMTLTFFAKAARYIRRARPDAIYVRGELVLPLARTFREIPIFWETHEPPGRIALYRRIFPQLAGIITITQAYQAELVALGVPAERVVVAPDGVDLAAFDIKMSKEEARQELGLPHDRKITVYTGTDIAWKGVATLREAARTLPREYLVAFVGNIAPDAPDARTLFTGFRPRVEIPQWLAAADAVVLTGTARAESSARYTSPLKLFEYLASGRPIVASDLPSFREVLDDSTAYFAAPDNPAALARAIEEACADTTRASRAHALAERYRWSTRGASIYSFIQTRLAR